MTMTVEEHAESTGMPTWQVAQAMIRLMQLGLRKPPDGTTPDAHIAHLEEAYPKPGNVAD